MPSSCKDIRAALAECLANSDCVFVHRNKPADCLRYPLSETLPTRCQQLKKGYGDCKRGMIDMRKRFRGNYPITIGLEGVRKHPHESGGQLYAGKSHYA
ncbi:cytochrome c oxidase assembly protein PET191-domain-containing protein, partial [Terfezia claveryi]